MTETTIGRVCLPLAGELVLARFVRRYKRFLIDAETDAGPITAHANNTGSMLGLLRPGATVAFSVSDNPKRRFPCTLEMVRLPLFRRGFFCFTAICHLILSRLAQLS